MNSAISNRRIIAAPVGHAAGGLFFFNPFSRLLIRQLKKQREHCCDDLVLQFKYDPHAYVSALLSLASRQRPVQKLAVAATGGSDKPLLQRARRISSNRKAVAAGPEPAPWHSSFSPRWSPPWHFISPPLPSTSPSIAQSHPPCTLPAANPRELAFSQPIHSTPPPASTHHQQQVRPRTPISREPATLQVDDNDIFSIPPMTARK